MSKREAEQIEKDVQEFLDAIKDDLKELSDEEAAKDATLQPRVVLHRLKFKPVLIENRCFFVVSK